MMQHLQLVQALLDPEAEIQAWKMVSCCCLLFFLGSKYMSSWLI